MSGTQNARGDLLVFEDEHGKATAWAWSLVGEIVKRPVYEPEGDVGAFLDRLYAWKQVITDEANRAFNESFRRTLRSRKR